MTLTTEQANPEQNQSSPSGTTPEGTSTFSEEQVEEIIRIIRERLRFEEEYKQELDWMIRHPEHTWL